MIKQDADDEMPEATAGEDADRLGLPPEDWHLLNSRPVDVYRHTDFPEFKAVIEGAIDELIRLRLNAPEATSHLIFPGNGRGARGCYSSPTRDQLTTLGYSDPSKGPKDFQKLRKHLKIVLLDACVSLHQDPAQWIGYSRSHDRYLTQDSRYNKLHLSGRFLLKAVDWLVEHGMLAGWKPAKDQTGLQSRFRAMPRLAAMLDCIPVEAIERDYSLIEPIILKAEKDPATGKAAFKEYDDEDHGNQPTVWRDNLAKINAQIASSQLGLALDAETLAKLKIDFSRCRLHRVFSNNDWNQNGRFFGGWWIGMKNRGLGYRQAITIDGLSTVEIDFSQIHPTILYLRAGRKIVTRQSVKIAVPGPGLPVPEDSYTIPGLERGKCKVVFNIMLNSKSIQDARGRVEHDDDLGPSYLHYIEAIKAFHPAIVKHFGQGLGLFMQNTDSKMAEQVMLEMVKRGVTVLPVHDSFIVQARYEGLLLSIMDTTLHQFFPELAGLSDGFNFKVTRADGSKEKLRSGIRSKS